MKRLLLFLALVPMLSVAKKPQPQKTDREVWVDIMYQMARRWWGSYYNEEKQQYIPVELDIIAESFDGKHLLLGECKWQEHIDAKEELTRLQTIANGLPFSKGHEIHYALFLRETPKNPDVAKIYYPDDVMAMH